MPTSLPVPSADPADLLFNAQKIDEIVNSGMPTYVDRLGVVRMTLAGATECAATAPSSFTADVSGAVPRTLLDKARERVSVADFGILPDGVTNWEGVNPGGAWSAMMASAVTNVIVWPPGYYATSMNLDSTMSGAQHHFEDGAVLGGVFHLLSDASPTVAAIATIARAANVVSVTTTTPHGYSSGQRVRIADVYVTGTNSVDFNTDDQAITIIGASAFSFSQVGPNESGAVGSGARVSQRPIKNVVITGRLTTTDRFGTINAKDCTVQRVWVKSDPANHSFFPGTTCRGAHIYVGTENLVIDELVIDDAGGANTDAALAIDGNAWNPRNCKFGRVHIRDSGCHGAYITGGGHQFGELRIDGFARDVYAGTLQDSDGPTQSQNVKALWINRAWDLHIDTLRTSQNQAGSRGFEQSQAVIDETGSAYFGSDWRGVHIGTWFATNVRRSGINFGDRDSDSIRCNVTVGLLELSLSPAGLSAGEFAVRAVGASGISRVSIDTLRLISLGANAGLFVETTADVSIRRLEALGFSDRLVQARGRLRIDDASGVYSGGTSGNPAVHLANPLVAGSRIDSLMLESTTTVGTRAVLSDSGASNWWIGKLSTFGFANGSGTVWIDGAASWGIHAFDMRGPAHSGIGVGFANTVMDGFMGPGVVKGFTQGFAKGSASFVRMTAVGLNGNGNTTPTDLANGSASMIGCNGVTL